MKQIVDKIKAELKKDGFDGNAVSALLSELRDWFKSNLNEPGLVRMIRLAFEDIDNNGEYTFLYLDEDGGKANLEYLVDLLADYNNKYNREELQDIRNLMEGITPEEEENSEETQQ